MLNRRSVLAAAALVPFAGRAATPAAAPLTIAGLPGSVTRHEDFAASRLAARHIDVWVPPQAGARPFPLLLMHDGQNLFDAKAAYTGQTWGIAEAIMGLAAAGTIPPMIVAGVWNSADRWREYVPADLLRRVPAVARARFEASQKGGSLSEAYLPFLADEVLPMLRREYPVAPGKVAIMGSSMGGLASLNALALRPDIFNRAGCLSTHWPVEAALPGEATDIMAAVSAYLRTRVGPPRGRKLWFDHGDQGLDQHYAPFQAAVDADLALLGWRRGRDFTSRAYPGAAHSEGAWRARIADPLTFLFSRTA